MERVGMGNILKEKSFSFALRVVKLAQYLNSDKKEYVLSKQVLRSGTAIGALVSEAEYAQSKPDFIHKLSIGLKEANETYYWLRLLHEGGYISETMFNSIKPQINELIKLLTSSINTAKKRTKAN
jgi:four helix bundle protein